MEDQMSSIEIFLAKLTNEIDLLEDQKNLIQSKIDTLKQKNSKFIEDKSSFQENKKQKIDGIKEKIKELNEDIERKRSFFGKLQGPTDEFLSSLENTYIAEYLPNKVAVNKSIPYNETNIIDIIGTILN
jgi:chromosome segregation ATPase